MNRWTSLVSPHNKGEGNEGNPFEGGVKSDIDRGEKDGEKDRDETDDLELWRTSPEGAGGETRGGGFGHDR